MKTLLIVNIHTAEMYVVTRKCAIDSPISPQRQIRPIHERLFTNTMSKTDTMALNAKVCWIGD